MNPSQIANIITEDVKINRGLILEYRAVLDTAIAPGDWSIRDYITQKLRLKNVIVGILGSPQKLIADLGRATLEIGITGNVVTVLNTFTKKKHEAPADKVGFVIDAITTSLGGKII